MPTYATQTARASEFVPWLCALLADKLALDLSKVKAAADPGEEDSPGTAERMLHLTLGSPTPVNPNAGGGRFGFPITRRLDIQVTTRTNLDKAGEDAIALGVHWDFQDDVLNVLAVREDSDFRFITPPKFLGSPEKVEKPRKVAPGVYRSVLVFEVNYAARLEVPA